MGVGSGVATIAFSLATKRVNLLQASVWPQAMKFLSYPSAAWLSLTALVLLASVATPAFAQRCTTQNGVTVCCDANGNCQTR